MVPLIRQRLIEYARDHHRPGDFLRAVLSNDLRDAVCRADPDNLHDIREIVIFINGELPSACHGSPEKFEAWLKLAGPTALPDLRQ